MRSSVWTLALLVAACGSLVACAPAEDEGADDQAQNVTGGSGSIESPVVYFFEGADTSLAPKCAGALLSERFAVTAKTCAAKGLSAGRAADKDGKRVRATVTAVQLPPAVDADIAVVELDRPLGGTHALITHMPLRDGYTVNGVATVDGKWFFSPDKGEAASVSGRINSETETHGSIVPEKGSQICAGDIGAPVCSSTAAKIAGFDVRGTCGLSGIVVGAPSDLQTTPSTGAASTKAAADATCSGGAWKVAELGHYADFLRRFAPEAFKPLVIDKPIIRNFPHAPEGLWGYKTGGDVKSCKIETAKLEPSAVGKATTITAKATFTNLQPRAQVFGRFGIAPKSAPTQMRWLGAKARPTPTATGFDVTFEGAIMADKDGDYVVAFRTSASGGESWTPCDLDGIDNGFSVDKALALKIGAGTPAEEKPAEGTPTPEKPAEAPGSTTPQDATPPAPPSVDEASSSDFSDSVSDSSDEDSSRDSSDAEEDEEAIAKRRASTNACSAAPGGSRTTTALPILGLLFGLAAFVRRRR